MVHHFCQVTHHDIHLEFGLWCLSLLDSSFSLASRAASFRSIRILFLITAALSGAERTTSWVEAMLPRVLDFTAHIHKQCDHHYGWPGNLD